MPRHPAVPAALGGAVVLTLLSLTLLAGPLDPPTGPVAPTYKTLAEVEPRTAVNAVNTPGDADSLFRITQPGSYYLTGNITGVAGKNGIEIVADGVTIDLMGFSLTGAAGSLDGITTSGVHGLITVRNGTVGGWGQDGIDLSPSGSGEASLVENIIASGNAKSGIVCASLAVVRSCAVANTLDPGGYGIRTGPRSIVEACAVQNNNGTGISVDDGSSVIDCTASFNGWDGVRAAVECVVRGCTARENVQHGVTAGRGSSIEACVGHLNGAIGVYAYENCTVSGCAAGYNGAAGFIVSVGSTITDCSASNNAAEGILASSGTLVSQCAAQGNNGHGIWVGGLSVVRANVCSGNGDATTGGAGIYVAGQECRIEGNNCSDNDIGIRVVVAVNLIFGNSCRSNSEGNYSIVAGNRVGTIVIPPVSGEVSGNGGAAGFGSTDPWANFAF